VPLETCTCDGTPILLDHVRRAWVANQTILSLGARFSPHKQDVNLSTAICGPSAIMLALDRRLNCSSRDLQALSAHLSTRQ
jgi:hypothetical protein